MWLEVVLRPKTPLIIDPFAPADGILSFAYAVSTGFKYKNENGRVKIGKLSLPKSQFQYILELPIEKEGIPDGSWFYRISVLFPKREIRKVETNIIRRPDYTNPYIREANKNLQVNKNTQADKKGKFKTFKIPISAVYSEEFVFYADVPEERLEEFEETVFVLERTGIGKKTGFGFGQVEVEVRETEVEIRKLTIEDRLIRPVPINYLEREPEIEIYKSILPPYYLPVDMRIMGFSPTPLLSL